MFYTRTSSMFDSVSIIDEDIENIERRVVFINDPERNTSFMNNKVTTTKYSMISFIPLFFYEQFRRWANVFFLVVALLQQIPDVSPAGRFTTVMPLTFILSLSAIKEIVEDIKRHRADNEINNRQVEVFGEDNWITVQWTDVAVGDIVKVLKDNFLPADLVLLASSEPYGMSYIETSLLDGETNLKARKSLPTTRDLTTEASLNELSGTIRCELPNRHIHKFIGVLKETGKAPESLEIDQLLPRGTILRNTSWIFGVAVYTGHETKIMKNSTGTQLKRSTIDKRTNHQMLFLFGVLLIVGITCSIFHALWTNKNKKSHWYIELETNPPSYLRTLLTFIILFGNLIPISLQVTLELVRIIQSFLINIDIEMYHEESDTPALARTSNLNDELGQVKYILSDKTGTLTKNIMKFKMCAVADDTYTIEENVHDSLMLQHMRQGHKNANFIKELLILLCVCHTVMSERMPDGSILYHADSPDEGALVRGASKFGYVFESRTPDFIEVNVLGVLERYEILTILEFTSMRRRMSVIVKDPDGKIKLFCKGADSVIYERLDPNEKKRSKVVLQHLDSFAVEGLRTLCCAVVDLSVRDYVNWKRKYHNACVSVLHREQQIDETTNLIEKGFRLIGAIAIEDELQDGVSDAIDSLLQADIKIWILTGDKRETAINIGYSCKLLSKQSYLIILKENKLETVAESLKRYCDDMANNTENQNDTALVIDGNTLSYALTSDLRTDFLKLCIHSKVVICCRVTPMQKAEVAEYVTKYTNCVTLAIGDGANDVAMIQTAHVGVGISGAEGLQAACASDFSIAQFRFLLRLILVHGAWNYTRTCKLILYSFYKNICFNIINLWFAIYSGWSGQMIFEGWSQVFFNIMFTSLPPLAVGLFDTPCSADKRMRYPKLYKSLQGLYNIKVFCYWVIKGMIHSVVLFWLPVLACQHNVLWVEGKDGGYLVLGNSIYAYVIVTVCLNAGLETTSWTWLTHCVIWGSIVSWFLFIIIYSMFWPTIPVGSSMSRIYIMLFSTTVFWLGFFVVPMITFLTDLTIKAILNTIYSNFCTT